MLFSSKQKVELKLMGLSSVLHVKLYGENAQIVKKKFKHDLLQFFSISFCTLSAALYSLIMQSGRSMCTRT